MFKKLLFSFLALLCAYNIAVTAYRIFEPKTDSASASDETMLDYDSLSQYIVSSGDNSIHYLFFYSSYDTNSIYVKETLLNTVEKDTSITIGTVIETVDVSSLDQNDELSRLRNEWGINDIPAFAAVTSENEKPVVLNQLCLSENSALTAAEIETWLNDNDIGASVTEDSAD